MFGPHFLADLAFNKFGLHQPLNVQRDRLESQGLPLSLSTLADQIGAVCVAVKPVHVYDTATGRPVAMLLRTGKTPSGAEVVNHVRRLERRIRRHWPTTRITLRGDGHYGRLKPMAWCEANDIDYVFGLPGNRALQADPIIASGDAACATDRALCDLLELRHYAETRYAAKSWGTKKRRVVARIEASSFGLDIRFVVTSLRGGSPERICDTLLRARAGREPHQLHKS